MKIRLLIVLLLFPFVCQAKTAQAVKDLLKKAPETRALAPLQLANKPLLKDFYLVFIFSSTCPHCHRFAPVLARFAAQKALPVEAYSLDGGSLSEFKSSKLTPFLFQTFYVNGGYEPVVPALFLVNKVTREGYAMLFGEASTWQLENRLHSLLTHIKAHYAN